MLKIPKKFVFALVSVFVLFGLFMLLSQGAPKTQSTGAVLGETDSPATGEVIDLYARAGYAPKEITTKANTPVTLRVTTKNTYDCSASFVIPKLNINAYLPPTGVTTFTIPPQDKGTEVTGGCAMGMYGFKIVFM